MKRTLLAMALLLTSVFGVTGCGSDDGEAPVESRIKNSTGDPPLVGSMIPVLCGNDGGTFVADDWHLEEDDRGDSNKCGPLSKPPDPEDTDTDDNDDKLSDLDIFKDDIKDHDFLHLDDDDDNTPPPSCMYVGDKYECRMDPPASADVEIGKPFAHLDDVDDDDGDTTPSPSYIFLGRDDDGDKRYAQTEGDDVDGG